MNKAIKREIVSVLTARDGYTCQFPGCTKPFTAEDPPTIDHWMPRSISGDERIENLKLMHFECNNLKGNIVPNADGTITITRIPKLPKAARPHLCEDCMSGRILLEGERCVSCGSGPQPVKFPTAYKRKPRNCSHAGKEHCWYCTLGFVERRELA